MFILYKLLYLYKIIIYVITLFRKLFRKINTLEPSDQFGRIIYFIKIIK